MMNVFDLSEKILFFFILDNRLNINKELPTTKWRRDRRIRLSSEYHHSNHEASAAAAAPASALPPTGGGVAVGTTIVKPLGESNQTNSTSDSNSMEIPLDMSVGAATKPPPPPYRDPLPGSTFCTAMSRPSVITQAPKREIISNQENKESPSAKKPMAICENPPPTGMCNCIRFCLLGSSFPQHCFTNEFELFRVDFHD